MEAVIMTGGKQYRVTEGQVIRVERLPRPKGEMVEFGEVLLLKKGDQALLGAKKLGRVKVLGEVVQQGRARKVTVFKFKRRKNYERKKGHRQPFTTVRITKIEAE